MQILAVSESEQNYQNSSVRNQLTDFGTGAGEWRGESKSVEGVQEHSVHTTINIRDENFFSLNRLNVYHREWI